MKTRIKKLRLDRGLTQEALAYKAGCRSAAISELENGKGNPELRTLEAIAGALDSHILDLFEDDRSDPDTQELIDRIKALDQKERLAYLTILPRRAG